MMTVSGWDIGGVNTKGAVLKYEKGQIVDFKVTSRYFEIWKDSTALASVLKSIEQELMGGNSEIQAARALTITAELSDIFRTKREGVEFILNCFQNTFTGVPLYALDIEGQLIGLQDIKDPVHLAATNWLATALFLGKRYKNGLLIDIGSTTTDIIPLRDGKVAAQGRTDMGRLVTGELVYTGVLRTPISSVVSQVPIKGEYCRISSEYFAILGDVYLILGYIQDSDYVCETPDRRPKTRQFAGERLARIVCADGETLHEEDIIQLARYIYEKQIQQVTEALMQVLSRFPDTYHFSVVACGLGEFLAKKCCERLGLKVQGISEILGSQASRVAPCMALAYLLAEKLD